MSSSLKDRSGVTTTDGIDEEYAAERHGAPKPINPTTGQHGSYYILTAEERAKGFVRPVRRSYRHVGMRPQHQLRPLTEEEHTRYDQFGYVAYEEYPEGSSTLGRFWTQKQLDSGCGSVTTMSSSIAETYARDPKFYGSTFCVNCGVHIAVEEFVWDGTEERVGS